jgi:DNA-binding CsgD family transcriptional regulator
MWRGPLQAARADLLLLQGRAEEAAASTEAAADAIEGDYVFFTGRMYTRGVRALAEVAERARVAGDAEAAAGAERRAEALVERVRLLLAPEGWEGEPPPESVARLAVAEAELARVAGRPDPGLWERAAARWRELGLPLDLAYAEWREAEALLSEGERTRAAELLERAASAAAKASAKPLLEEVIGLARRARIPLPEGDVDEAPAKPEVGTFGLTDRELEVLELLAEGKTNREIGETLFISAKTASVHVSRILAKLDVRGRVEAATAAHRLGLIRESAREKSG